MIEKDFEITESEEEPSVTPPDTASPETVLPDGKTETSGGKFRKPKKEKPVLTPEEKKKKIINSVKYWTVLNIGVLLLSLGVHMFEIPNNFVMGGVSGLSILITPPIKSLFEAFDENILITIINVVLLVLGFIFLGKGVGLKTVFCTVMYNIELWLFEWLFKFIPMELPLSGAENAGSILEAVYAVVTVGVAQAIIFYCGASSGGTDIIALIVKKYAKVNIGPAIIASDFVIAFIAFFVPWQNPEVAMVSVLGVALRSFAIDGIIENIAKTKYVTIITEHPDIVGNIIFKEVNRGYTKYSAQGGYTGDQRTIIITVCQRAQAIRLKEKLLQEEPSSFTIITDANEILGKGFAAKF